MHAEEAHALATKGQTIVNAPDVTIIKLYVDDEPLFVPTARLHGYARVLDMSAGILSREFVWATAAGKHVRVRSGRIVSLEHRHVVAMTYEVTVLDAAAPVAICSLVLNRQDSHHEGDGRPEHLPGDPRLATVLPHRVLNASVTDLAGQRIVLGYQTTNSGMTLAVGVDHVIDAACPYQVEGRLDGDTGEIIVTADARPGVPIKITKYAAYQASRGIEVPELAAGAAGPWTGRYATGSRSWPRPTGEPGPVLGPGRRPGAAAAVAGAAAAGDPVEPLPGRAGVMAGRGGRDPGEGADRAGLRGALLLGHRGVRAAVLRPTPSPRSRVTCSVSGTAC